MPVSEGIWELLDRCRGFRSVAMARDMEAHERDPAEVMILSAEAALVRLMRRCVTSVPFYRNWANRNGISAFDIKGGDSLRRFPVVDKKTISSEFNSFVSCDLHRPLSFGSTGGTSGIPFRFGVDRRHREYDRAVEMRFSHWYGRTRLTKLAKFGGYTLASTSRVNALRNSVRRILWISALDLSEEGMAMAVQRINRFRPEVFRGYPTALRRFADYVLDAGAIIDKKPTAVVSTSEILTEDARERIEEAFSAPVWNEYGSGEGSIAHECEYHSGMHVAIENVWVEIVDRDGKQAESGETGEILVTFLRTFDFPMVRYRIGDVGSWARGPCACGRNSPRLSQVEGRTTNQIVLPDGRMIGEASVSLWFNKVPWVADYQVVQVSRSEIEVRILPNSIVDVHLVSELKQRISRIVSPATVSVTHPAKLVLAPSGKRPIIVPLGNADGEMDSVT